MGIDAGMAKPGLSVVNVLGPTWQSIGSTVLFSGYYETAREADKNTSVASDDARRIRDSCSWIRANVLQFRPRRVVVELPVSGAKSAMALKCMAMASSYTVAVLHMMEDVIGSPAILYSPYDTKKVCTGDAHADKSLMIEAAKRTWPDVQFPMKKTRTKGVHVPHPQKSEAMADSLCAILTHIRLHLGKPIL
jgi:Holliday junction resolvasome RuvABC endonuclease subunit